MSNPSRLACGTLTCAVGLLLAQSTVSRPVFEVASVKRNATNGESNFTPKRSGDRVTMHNIQVGSVVYFAYNLKYNYQMSGSLDLPLGWNWYDFEAIAPPSTSEDDLRLMFQVLLEDRFKLKVHRETREMATYDLVMAKGGSKLHPAEEDSKLAIDGKPLRKGDNGAFAGRDGLHLIGKGATMAQMVNALIGSMGGPVVDKTGLDGTFDYDVPYTRGRPSKDGVEDNLPELPQALQSVVGLKLERGKGPVEVLVIDHIEKPTENQ